MAVRLRKDGRWTVYNRSPEGRQVKEYFGHGPDAEAWAYQGDPGLGLQRRRLRCDHPGPTFLELAKEYRDKKDFNDNFRYHLRAPRGNPHSAFRLQASSAPPDRRRRRLHEEEARGWYRRLDDLPRAHRPQSNFELGHETRPPADPVQPDRKLHQTAGAKHRFAAARVDDTLKIIEHAPPHLKRYIFLPPWYLGLCPGAVELLRLRWDAVRWDRRRILVISADKGGPEAREVPIHEVLLSELRAWWKADMADGLDFIIHFNCRPIKSIRKEWWTTLERAGLRVRGADGEIDKTLSRRIRPYDLRHSFITQALDRDADLKALSEVVGSSPKTLLKFYQHVTSSMHEKTVALVAPLKLDKKDHKKPKGSHAPKETR